MGFFIILILGGFVGIIAGIVSSTKSPSRDRITKADIRNKLVSLISQTFSEIGWNLWDKSIHSLDEQLTRLERAVKSKKMSVLDYNEDTKIGSVMGEKGGIYTVGADGCSCPDFNHRGLPCKHMYFLAMIISEDREKSKGR